jgi:hypothetical protein
MEFVQQLIMCVWFLLAWLLAPSDGFCAVCSLLPCEISGISCCELSSLRPVPSFRKKGGSFVLNGRGLRKYHINACIQSIGDWAEPQSPWVGRYVYVFPHAIIIFVRPPILLFLTMCAVSSYNYCSRMCSCLQEWSLRGYQHLCLFHRVLRGHLHREKWDINLILCTRVLVEFLGWLGLLATPRHPCTGLIAWHLNDRDLFSFAGLSPLYRLRGVGMSVGVGFDPWLWMGSMGKSMGTITPFQSESFY